MAKPKKRPAVVVQPPPTPEVAKVILRVRTVEEVCSTARTLFKVTGYVLGAFFLYKTASVVAGTTTLFTVVVNFLASVSVSKWAAWLFAGLAGLYGFAERKARQRAVKRLGDRVKELESKWDKKRSSSRLTESGKTHPEDR